MVKLIIFDWDDVFTLNATRGYYACYGVAVASVAPGIPTEQVVRGVNEMWGRPAVHVLAHILGSDEHVESAHEVYSICLFSNVYSNELSIVDGAVEFLRRIAQHYTLAIATGIHPRLLTEHVMPRFDVPRHLFGQIISSYDLPDQSRGKPHPDMLHKLLVQQRVAPADAVMVGDASGDMKMAFAAGVRPVAVLTGHMSRLDAEQLGVRDIIDSVTDLESILERW